ncbi:helix-turn-helix transcriptional regulator [Streptomyces sp. H27-H1]|uniref:AraC family transcriptional regulator n=1 Tax=Streptomyces sp. H27-H1 TaxID=2996461 RepID=UPI00226E71A1|nr:helix-turn-helix transcriptional regulator [Streptomyces sp. H27-H1]MCY0928011.1 helix-turn-helix transcriptional regulator [Streptomyces sp. H27-H1]
METMRFSSGDLDATEEFLSAAYTPMRIGGRPDDTRARIERNATDDVIVDRLRFGYEMAYDADCLNRICLITMHSGTLVDTTGGREEVFGPGETFLIAQPDRPYTGAVRSASYTITMFDPALLGQAAPSSPQPVRLTGHRAVSPAANRLLGTAVAFVRDHVLADPVAAASPLLVGTAARHLAAAALTALPSTMSGVPDSIDSRDGGSDTLARAVAFIEENAHRDIGLTEIADSIPVTPRAVQYAFARHTGTTPLAYLRRVRLARAHTDLKAASPASATVQEIALRWGFAHQGRFAAAYHDAYNSSPSHTLRT